MAAALPRRAAAPRDLARLAGREPGSRQDNDWTRWADLLERAAFDGPAGVKFGGAGSATPSQVFTITNWQRSGDGFVKDMLYNSTAYDTGASAISHVKLELVPAFA